VLLFCRCRRRRRRRRSHFSLFAGDEHLDEDKERLPDWKRSLLYNDIDNGYFSWATQPYHIIPYNPARYWECVLFLRCYRRRHRSFARGVAWRGPAAQQPARRSQARRRRPKRRSAH